MLCNFTNQNIQKKIFLFYKSDKLTVCMYFLLLHGATIELIWLFEIKIRPWIKSQPSFDPGKLMAPDELVTN